MRRLVQLVLAAALIATVLAGCGSSSSTAANPVTTELSYFPDGSPLVLSIATDPNSAAVKNTQALIHRLPLATVAINALMGKLGQRGIDYQRDIRPLFGNPIMVGLTGSLLTNHGAGVPNYLVVWVTKDAGKLRSLVKKVATHEIGSHSGATLYQATGNMTLAVDGATAVLGRSQASVDSAIDRHSQAGGISLTQYSQSFTGLPQDAIVHAFGNLTAVLSQASAAKARRVPWVAAFRGYAATVTASASGLRIDFRLDTSGGTLTAAQVPFSSTTTPPSLAGNLPITVGIQDPAHIVQFVEQTFQQVDPSSYAKFLARQSALRRKTGVDLNQMLHLLKGNLIIGSDTHTTMGRAQVSNPSQAASDLAKLASSPRSVFSHASGISSLGGGFYAIHEPRTTITVGIAGNQLVAGKANVGQLRAFAAAPTVPATGAHGSVAFRVSLASLLRLAIPQAPPAAGQILNSLGDITGWIAGNTSGITGNATLAVH